MKIGSILEDQALEKRIAITPELVKKYTSLGFEISLIENYGSHLGVKDEQFIDMGVKISKNENDILESAQSIKFHSSPTNDESKYNDNIQKFETEHFKHVDNDNEDDEYDFD